MICIQKIYGFHRHQIIKESWDVTSVTNGGGERRKVENHTLFCWTRNHKFDLNMDKQATNGWIKSNLPFGKLKIEGRVLQYPFLKQSINLYLDSQLISAFTSLNNYCSKSLNHKKKIGVRTIDCSRSRNRHISCFHILLYDIIYNGYVLLVSSGICFFFVFEFSLVFLFVLPADDLVTD